MEDDKENIEQFSEEEEEEMCSACDTENESVNSFEAQKEENQSLNEENENSFVLKIKRLDNSSIQVTGLTEDSDIKDLKAKLREQIGVLPENQRLIFRGKALTSGSLKAHHIGNESWLHLVERDPSIGVQAAQPTSSDLAGRSGSERTERQQPQRISLSDALGDSMSVLLASALRSSSRAAPTAALPARNSFQFHDTSLEHIWQGLTTVNSLVDSFEEWSNRRNTSEGKIVLNELEPVFADLDGLTDYLQEGKAGDESESQETIPGIRKFECGQWIDVLDTVNQWLEATVMHVSPDGMKILVHYNAWGERWDEVLDVRSERIAPFRTKTKHRDSCQNLSATPATWVKSAPRVGNGNLNDVLPKALRSMERVLPLLRDVCTEDNAEKNLEKILYLAPMFDRMGRVLGDVASKLAENPTLATKKRLISVWPFTAVGQSIIPFSMYITAGKDLSRRNVMLKERGFDSDFLQLINHSHEPTSRSGNLDIHIHAILTPFQQTPSATEASDN